MKSWLIPKKWRLPFGILKRWGIFTWGRLGRVFALSIASIVLEVAGIAMLYPILNFVEAGRNVEVLAATSALWQVIAALFKFLHLPVTLATLSMLVVILVSLRQVANYYLAITIEEQKWTSGAELGQRCFSTLLNSSARHLQTITTGRFVSLIDNDAQASASLWRAITTSLRLVMSFFVYGVMMFITSPMISLLSLALILVVTFSLRGYINVSRAVGQAAQDRRRILTQVAAERWQAWKVLRLSGRLKDEIASFGEQSRLYRDASVDVTRITQRVQLFMAPVMTALALVVVYVAIEVMSQPVSIVTLFILVLLRFMPIAQTLAGQTQSMAIFAVSAETVDRELREAKQFKEPNSGIKVFEGVNCEVRFEDVSFSYEHAEGAALEKLSLTIPGGRLTAVTGPSGAGKSTLSDLLPRLILPQSGRILIDGTPIEEYSLESLRKAISYAPQHAFIFNASVRANVRYAKPDATDAEVELACRRAHAHDFIVSLSDGYDTVLGEGGSRLSGGQRQRLALARVFLARPNILILDEPTSALDHESEQHVNQGLRELADFDGTTVVVVAHHLATVLAADHLIVLESGRLTASGPPAELVAEHPWLMAMLHSSRRTDSGR